MAAGSPLEEVLVMCFLFLMACYEVHTQRLDRKCLGNLPLGYVQSCAAVTWSCALSCAVPQRGVFTALLFRRDKICSLPA